MAGYPPYRRAQRLSYAVAALTPEVDRQQLLLAPSTMARLILMTEFLTEARKGLEVAIAMRVAGIDPTEGGGLEERTSLSCGCGGGGESDEPGTECIRRGRVSPDHPTPIPTPAKPTARRRAAACWAVCCG